MKMFAGLSELMATDKIALDILAVVRCPWSVVRGGGLPVYFVTTDNRRWTTVNTYVYIDAAAISAAANR